MADSLYESLRVVDKKIEALNNVRHISTHLDVIDTKGGIIIGGWNRHEDRTAPIFTLTNRNGGGRIFNVGNYRIPYICYFPDNRIKYYGENFYDWGARCWWEGNTFVLNWNASGKVSGNIWNIHVGVEHSFSFNRPRSKMYCRGIDGQDVTGDISWEKNDW